MEDKFKRTCIAALIGIVLPLFILNSCKKETTPAPAVLQTDSMTDIDGNVYKTVKIGNQWWMAENLKTVKYRNGQFLFTPTSTTADTVWDTITKGAWCAYKDDLTDSTGYLYNWYAVHDTSNIAPAGWHIPTDAEWNQLEMAAGLSSADADKEGFRGARESEKLKHQGQDYWKLYGDIWATNESGFSALAGGCRMFNGTNSSDKWSYPYGHQYSGFWWTATEQNDNEAWYRYMDYKNANVFRGHDHKNYGFSIRCVKDN